MSKDVNGRKLKAGDVVSRVREVAFFKRMAGADENTLLVVDRVFRNSLRLKNLKGGWDCIAFKKEDFYKGLRCS